MEVKDILVINPGSTSTKIAVFSAETSERLFQTNIVHDEEKINSFPTIASQKDYRREMIMDYLAENNYDLKNLSGVIGRGGMIVGLKGRGYIVNDALYAKMGSTDIPKHASSLGAILAKDIADTLGLKSFIYDSTTGCDLIEETKVTGIADIEKYGSTHLLNSRAQAIKFAEEAGRNYEDMQLIVCHMGGGITINTWRDGKVIDTAAYDDGPMSPERSGGVPLLLFTKLCFDGKHTQADIENLVSGQGGLYSYLGTKDCRQVEAMIADGNKKAEVVYKAMALQIAKGIAGLSCTLEGKIDGIILTGGIAYSKMLTDMIKKYCGHIGEITVMAGENEMEALFDGAVRMLKGEEGYSVYE